MEGFLVVFQSSFVVTNAGFAELWVFFVVFGQEPLGIDSTFSGASEANPTCR